jgi:hypothetical protein
MSAYKTGYDKIDWRPLPPVDKPPRIRPARSGFPTPMIVSDSCDALQSMANGEFYDSKSALRHSYTADGNPQGRDYDVIGNQPIEGAGRAPVDKKAIRDTLEKAMHDVAAGNVSDEIKAIQ